MYHHHSLFLSAASQQQWRQSSFQPSSFPLSPSCSQGTRTREGRQAPSDAALTLYFRDEEMHFLALSPQWLSGKESACNSEDKETQVQSLGWKDALEEEMATTPVLLPGRSHGQRNLVDYSLCGHRVGYDWTHTHAHAHACTVLYHMGEYSVS